MLSGDEFDDDIAAVAHGELQDGGSLSSVEQPGQVIGSETENIWDDEEFNKAMESFDYSAITDFDGSDSSLSTVEQPELALVSEDQDVITAAKPKSGSDIIDVESSDSSLSTAEQPELALVSEDQDVITAPKPQSGCNTFAAEQKRLAQMAKVADEVCKFKKQALELKKDIAVLEPILRSKWSFLRFAQGRIKFYEFYLKEQQKVSAANKLERLYKVAILKKGFANSSTAFSASQPAPSCFKCSRSFSPSSSQP